MARAREAPSYRCAHCGRVVKRASDKAWIKSWCANTHRFTRLMRQAVTPTRAHRHPLSQ